MPGRRRPALCRLCQCPVGADGVPVNELDALKLHRWWLQELQTEWDDDDCDGQCICQFCLWDAKFQDENREDRHNEEVDWWTGYDTNQFFRKFYYEEQILQPLAVSMLPLGENCEPSGGALETDETRKEEFASTRRRIPTDCLFCGKSFRSRRAAFQHAMDSHEKSKTAWNCPNCHIFFENHDEILDHRNKMHTPRILCHVCSNYTGRHTVAEHFRENHPGRVECCGMVFASVDAVADHHLSVKLVKKNKCVYCDQIFVSGLHKHVRRQHKSESVSCHYQFCKKYFLTQEEKSKHVQEVHENKPGLVGCVYCECRVARGVLPRHVDNWHKSVAIRCSFFPCLSFFHTKKDKEQHELQVHLATRVAPGVKCIYCGNKSNFTTDLLIHVKRYHKDEAIRCKIRGCCRFFLSQAELQDHFAAMHAAKEQNRKWPCAQCGARYLTQISLKRHLLQRHGTERLRCPKCPKILNSEYSLRTHLNSSHVKEHFCVHCKSTVKRSIFIHLNVRPCIRCKKVVQCMGLKREHDANCKRLWRLKKVEKKPFN